MQAVSIEADGLIYQAKEMVAKLALARRMALVAYLRKTFDSDALMPYGPDNIQATQRAAALVDKILKGTKPGAPADRARRLMWNWTPWPSPPCCPRLPAAPAPRTRAQWSGRPCKTVRGVASGDSSGTVQECPALYFARITG
jgi:hypothetical protein